MVNKVINDHLYVVQLAPGIERVVNIGKIKHFQRNKNNEVRYLLIDNPTVINPRAQSSLESSDDSSDSEDELMVTQDTLPRRQISVPKPVGISRNRPM